MLVPHASGCAAALPPEGAQFAPRDGPSARTVATANRGDRERAAS